MTLQAIGRNWANVTIPAFSKVSVFKGPIYIGLPGTTDDNRGVKIGDEFYAAAGAVYGFRGPGWIDVTAYTEPGLPAAFAVGNWSIAAGVLKATVTVSTIPNLNGSTIVAIEYRVGSGPWLNAGRTTTGTFEIAPLTAGAHSVALRVVSLGGAGPLSDVKSVTATAS